MDIVAIAAGRYYTVGLKSDGTVVAVGGNCQGQCNVSDWTDIVAVAAEFRLTVGLKSDGTVVAVGDNDFGQCNISGWKLFNNIDKLDEESREARKAAEEQRERERIAAEEQRIENLKQEATSLRSELASLHGLFTGKRRREIEARLAQINREISKR